MAKDWFQEQFNRSGSEYEIPKKYWIETRCFNDSDAKAFEIGYAPADRFALGRFLSQQGILINYFPNQDYSTKDKQTGIGFQFFVVD